MTSREEHIAQANENIEKDRSCVQRVMGRLTDLDELLSRTKDDLVSVQGGTDMELSHVWIELDHIYSGLRHVEVGLDSPERTMQDIRRFLGNTFRET